MSQETLACFSLIISITTLCVAVYIPHRIMINQIFAGLLASYRSPEMGAAILAIFHFYTKDCGKDPQNIAAAYEKKYNEQIKEKLQTEKEIAFSQTLHFQRRLVAQFYFHMAVFRYNYCCIVRLSKKNMRTWFMPDDAKLLGLILHMAEPAHRVFIDAGEVSPPYKDETPMNELICKLYNEVSERAGRRKGHAWCLSPNWRGASVTESR